MSVVTWAAMRGPIGVTEGAAGDVVTNLMLDARMEGDTAFVTCHGRIAHGATARRFRACIGSVLRRYRQVVVDLGAVTHIDARGVGMLARLVAQAKAADRRLILARSSDRVGRVLRLTRLDVELHNHSIGDRSAPPPQPLRTVDSSSQLLCPFRAGGRLQRMRGLQGQMTNAGVDTATVTAERQPRLYTDLAAWWPLFSPPSEYVEEAADLLPALLAVPDRPPATLLELGSGGGSLACHLKARLTLTLSDRSADMLAVSQKVNPGCEYVLGDMRTLDLGREFDLVLIHDAIMCATDSASVRASLATAYRHCRPGGAALIVPDCVRETFQERTSTGGIDATDGRGLRYLEWTWDPNPRDESFEVALAFILRDPSGAIRSDSDRHRCGLFPRAAWLAWIDEAGFAPSVRVDAWGRDVFTGKKTGRSE